MSWQARGRNRLVLGCGERRDVSAGPLWGGTRIAGKRYETIYIYIQYRSSSSCAKSEGKRVWHCAARRAAEQDVNRWAEGRIRSNTLMILSTSGDPSKISKCTAKRQNDIRNFPRVIKRCKPQTFKPNPKRKISFFQPPFQGGRIFQILVIPRHLSPSEIRSSDSENRPTNRKPKAQLGLRHFLIWRYQTLSWQPQTPEREVGSTRTSVEVPMATILKQSRIKHYNFLFWYLDESSHGSFQKEFYRSHESDQTSRHLMKIKFFVKHHTIYRQC